ncbi:MAG: GNAT family N-acetyltransferase, partial [Salibacteraceae bacterium]
MVIKGEQVVLEPATIDELDVIYQWENDPDYWLVSNTVVPYTREQIETFLLNNKDIYETGQLRLMIKSKDERIAGCVDLYDFDPKNKRSGIGILIDPIFRGKGLGLEAINLLATFCFEKLDLNSLYAEVLVTNPSSIKLFESAHFELTGIKKA